MKPHIASESIMMLGVYQHARARRKLSKPQSFVAKYENGERRLDMAEFITIAEELGVDPVKILRSL